jgi:hypothetical protein
MRLVEKTEMVDILIALSDAKGCRVATQNCLRVEIFILPSCCVWQVDEIGRAG